MPRISSAGARSGPPAIGGDREVAGIDVLADALYPAATGGTRPEELDARRRCRRAVSEWPLEALADQVVDVGGVDRLVGRTHCGSRVWPADELLCRLARLLARVVIGERDRRSGRP